MQRNETMYIKSGNRFTPVVVRQEYQELPAVRVTKGSEDWILKREELMSKKEVDDLVEKKRLDKLKEHYNDILKAFCAGDTHLTIAAKLGILPMVAFNKLKAIKSHGLI